MYLLIKEESYDLMSRVRYIIYSNVNRKKEACVRVIYRKIRIPTS